jgi:hypothetical protein
MFNEFVASMCTVCVPQVKAVSSPGVYDTLIVVESTEGVSAGTTGAPSIIILIEEAVIFEPDCAKTDIVGIRLFTTVPLEGQRFVKVGEAETTVKEVVVLF